MRTLLTDIGVYFPVFCSKVFNQTFKHFVNNLVFKPIQDTLILKQKVAFAQHTSLNYSYEIVKLFHYRNVKNV